ncbi:MAG: HAD family hydrolase [Planctomycetota bacterium]
MEYKCLVFDLDGTIIDTSYGIIKSVNLSLLKENLPSLPYDKIIPYIGKGAKKLISSLFEIINIHDEKTYKSVCDNFYEYYSDFCDRKLRLLVDLQAILKLCRDKELILAIFTNKDTKFTTKILKTLKIDIEEIICPPQFPLKPDIEGIKYLMNKYKLGRNNIIIIGDSVVDYQTATNANTHCILVTWGFTELNELKSCEKAIFLSDPLELLKFFNYNI